MRTLLIFSLIFSLLLPQQSFSSIKQAEELLVQGTQPGPGLWRLTREGNELWILGTLSPLPKDLQWDSSSVEAILADSQEVIFPSGVHLGMSRVKSIFMAPFFIGVKNNPNRQKLNDILDDELYNQWDKLRSQYLGNSKKIERLRPFFAGEKLYNSALQENGLSHDEKVWKVIHDSIKKHKINQTHPSIYRKITHVRKTIKSFKKTSLNDHICFQDTLNRIDHDIENMQKRAVAWSMGDLDHLRKLPYRDQNPSCGNAILSSSLAKEFELENAESELQELWFKAIDEAINRNEVSFAILPIQVLLTKNDLWKRLDKMKITVKPPSFTP